MNGRVGLGVLGAIAALAAGGRLYVGIDPGVETKRRKGKHMDMHTHTNGSSNGRTLSAAPKDRRPVTEQLAEAQRTIADQKSTITSQREAAERVRTENRQQIDRMYKEQETANEKARTAESKASNAEQALRVANEQIDALKKTVTALTGAVAVQPVARRY